MKLKKGLNLNVILDRYILMAKMKHYNDLLKNHNELLEKAIKQRSL